MEIQITDQLAALAHQNRLDLFRLLMRRFPDFVPAGEIARSLNLKANTASTYLGHLRQAGLIRQERQGASLRYQANVEAMTTLMETLLGGCCQNRPDVCLKAQPEGQGTPPRKAPFNVLFICTGNSARSILAEAILNRLGEGKFQAFSAGAHPGDGPRPEVLKLLTDKGYDTGHLKSQPIAAFSDNAPNTAPEMDFVFTVCDNAANEVCPTLPGQPISAHWGLPDPSEVNGDETAYIQSFQYTYGLLLNRIRTFIALPIETLDKTSLQHRLDDIGRAKPGPNTATHMLNTAHAD